MPDQDIYDLQIKISYMEDFIKKLNSVVIEQSEENRQLKHEINRLKDKLHQLEERLENKDSLKADEAPPHY